MKKKITFKRILAIIAVFLILGMYILSLVAVFSDWECKKEIFLATLAATIFVPIIIYIIQVFARLSQKNTEPEKTSNKNGIANKARLK